MTPRQKRMKKIVAAMQVYVATYSEQGSYLDYSDETFINDMLYGIGIVLDRKEYECATGFDRFKAALKRYLPSAVKWRGAQKDAATGSDS